MIYNYSNFILENKNNNIICYHRSHSLEHMINNNFSLEFSNNDSIFGKAIYFSQSPNISTQLGNYICKFEIILKEPILDMNKVISTMKANDLLNTFNTQYKLNIKYDFDNDYDNVQYGNFFLELQDFFRENPNVYYKDFIQSLGYNSFIYNGDYGTNFIENLGDYGKCYGIYNPKDIKFVDGPF